MIRIRLNEILLEKKKSIYWLAEETGITYPTLHKIATKETISIKLEVLEKICTAFNINIEELIVIEDEKKA